jgi:hypothetical protein
MRGLKGLSKLVIVAMTAATLMLMAAVGVSAASGTFGSTSAVSSALNVISHNLAAKVAAANKSDGDHKDKDKNKCKGDDDHDNSTPGHKHHPCDEGGEGGGDHNGGGDHDSGGHGSHHHPE